MEEANPIGLLEFWQSMGVDHQSMLELLAEVNPQWDTSLKVLRISALVYGRDGWFEMVRSCIMFNLQWMNWSDTRWAKMGVSSRLYVRSRAVGVDGLVSIITAGKDSSSDRSFIGGYARYSTFEVQRLFVVCASAVLPAEHFIVKLIEDDRFLFKPTT